MSWRLEAAILLLSLVAAVVLFLGLAWAAGQPPPPSRIPVPLATPLRTATP